MIVIKQRRSKKGSIYWIWQHIPDPSTAEQEEETYENWEWERLVDHTTESEFGMIFLRDEIEKVLKRANLGDLAVRITFLLMDGWTRADIARKLKLPYDKVDYLYRKIKKALASYFLNPAKR